MSVLRKGNKRSKIMFPSLVPRPLSEKLRRGLATQPYNAVFCEL